METSPGIAQPNEPEGAKAPKRQGKTSTALATANFVNDAWAEHDRGLQNRTTAFLLRAYGLLLAATMLIFYLQGFRPWGFHLAETTLHWIGASTIGQTAGLLTITIKLIFSKVRRKG